MKIADSRPVHAAYVRHLNRCREAAVGRQCQTCRDLLRDADAESWRAWTRTLHAKRQPVAAGA